MCLRERRPLPKAIQEAPELTLGLEFAYQAYWDLNSCRSYGFGMGPISWSFIMDYARAHELEPDEIDDFTYLIRKMDEAHCKHVAEQNAAPAKK